MAWTNTAMDRNVTWTVLDDGQGGQIRPYYSTLQRKMTTGTKNGADRYGHSEQVTLPYQTDIGEQTLIHDLYIHI